MGSNVEEKMMKRGMDRFVIDALLASETPLVKYGE